MLDTLIRPTTAAPLIRPGQRFLTLDHISTTGSREVLVSRVERTREGLMQVVLRSDDDREVRAYLDQVTMAIELGQLQPVSDELDGIAC